MALALRKRTLTLVVVLALALLGWWMQRQEQGLDVQPEESELVLDYSLSDFEIIAMDQSGQPRHRLQAESLLHYAGTDYAELKRPQLQLYRGAMGPTLLDAETALVYQDGDAMMLQGEVRIKRHDPAQQKTLEVLTRDLWFYEQREVAETEAEVIIKDKKGTTTAKGMVVDMKAGSIELQAAVRGKYALE